MNGKDYRWKLNPEHYYQMKEWEKEDNRNLNRGITAETHKSGYSQPEIAEMRLFDRIKELEKTISQMRVIIEHFPKEIHEKTDMYREFIKDRYNIDLPTDEEIYQYSQRFNDLASKYKPKNNVKKSINGVI